LSCSVDVDGRRRRFVTWIDATRTLGGLRGRELGFTLKAGEVGRLRDCSRLIARPPTRSVIAARDE
jgi:hypothetical protein